MTQRRLTDEEITDFAYGWACEDQFDFEDYLDRMERSLDVDLPGDLNDPEIKRIRKITNHVRRDARS